MEYSMSESIFFDLETEIKKSIRLRKGRGFETRALAIEAINHWIDSAVQRKTLGTVVSWPSQSGHWHLHERDGTQVPSDPRIKWFRVGFFKFYIHEDGSFTVFALPGNSLVARATCTHGPDDDHDHISSGRNPCL
jgi:hypothetical protein